MVQTIIQHSGVTGKLCGGWQGRGWAPAEMVCDLLESSMERGAA